MNNFKIKLELDCRQLKCPMPVIKTRKTIESLDSGDIIKMISTDPGSINDIRAWSRRTGNPLLSEKCEDGEFIFIISKK